MMVIYDGTSPRREYVIFIRPPFDGCHGTRKGSMCNWVVPGTWPDWML